MRLVLAKQEVYVYEKGNPKTLNIVIYYNNIL